jgi:alkyl hydroperoxide reductase subunit AhpC
MQGVVEHITMNNFPVGRSVDEALRTLQAVQFVAEHGEVCPANWTPGGATMIADPEKSLDYFESASSSQKV